MCTPGNWTAITTMIYNRPTQQQTKADIEKVLVVKQDLNNKNRIKAVVDKFLHGELADNELTTLLRVIQPKELKQDNEFTGCS